MRPLPLLLLTSGCTVIPATLDISDEPLDQAVALSLDRLEATYAFTEHKQLDWDQARDELLPLAEAAMDEEEADEVLRHLVPHLPDAHVRLYNDDPTRDLCPGARATHGLTLSDLDDGRVIVVRADADSGLEPGDEVLAWGGLSVDQARDEVPLHCFPVGMATRERVAQVQLRLLTRAALDEEVEVRVLRDGVEHGLILEARPADDAEDVQAALGVGLPPVHADHGVLPEGFGYVYLGWEEVWITEHRFQRALAALSDTPGLVVDLRANDGGMERTAANVAGYFATELDFYETVTFLDNRSGQQVVMSEVWLEPQELYWGRPVAVLVDADTVSSGEGLAMLLSRQPQVRLFGFEGTAASFGSTGSTLLLPGGWRLEYPGGRSLDAQGEIQLDSDASMEGGVHPDLRVPWTEETRLAWGRGEDVVLEHAVAWLEEVSP